MKLPFLSSLFVFIIWLAYEIKKHRAIETKPLEDFLAREREADNTPVKPLDNLDYIVIPLEALPTGLFPEDEEIRECVETLVRLSENKIVNLTGFSNTDLKLAYGALNIGKLSTYDQNYTVLARTLQKWANLLIRRGRLAEAVPILEFSVETKTDVSEAYRILAEYYAENGMPDKIAALRETAESLRSLQKPVILKLLSSYAQEEAPQLS